jgi:thiamine kinase-like enzyme
VADLDQVLDGLAARLGPVTAGPVPLEGGITNRNYRVGFGGSECVLRLPGKDTALLGISREAERIASQAAAELGIGPALITGDEHCLVTEYLAAQVSDLVTIQRAPEPVADALRRFHASGVRLPERFWVPDLLDTYAEIVHGRAGRLPEAFEEARELTRRCARSLPLTDPVPCHNDLLPGNVLHAGDGRVMLVDWEYAGMGHRMFDLANLAAGAELAQAGEQRLLAAYLQRDPVPAEHAALQLMRLMSDAREAAWGMVQGVISDLSFDFGAYAQAHFERFRARAADPRLEEWLSAAAA